ncbi:MULTISPECIES: sugar phosphate isomerase/epimerase family protein [Actinoalloteichus]|uniref:Sugar phosphate isomerase/epimerase n=1 Tax=Actinoalloteichus fjordicus TaxID=1612552 RepID=A0AAC9PSG8_9PSEU|nr:MULTISPECIES: sugar phosphate isomerase/epimerase [Actinoalloteichus]APU14826.1 sugar phosphate isomerase/epimerase [Actinoalloteichus fjordicus]APU20795.1 sugar phosphate isomerase/epimerase [Actinoalloteichus sp. GBA129-24]
MGIVQPESRRGFLRLAGGAAVAVGASGLITANAAATPGRHRRVPREHIGIQLYTVRSLMESDPQGTLNRLGEIGYATVGVSGLYGHRPQEFRAMLDTAGLRAVLTHLSLDAIRGDWQQALADAHVLGVQSVVVPSLPGELQNPAGYRQVAGEFNVAGLAARKAGLRFLYHNHGFDFATVDGEVLYDILVEETDRRLVNFELDLYWAVDGGYDPVDYFRRYPGRFPVFHVKDMAADGSFEDVGHGTLDFPRMFAERRSGVREYVVEHDAPADPLNSALRSYEYLSTMRF